MNVPNKFDMTCQQKFQLVVLTRKEKKKKASVSISLKLKKDKQQEEKHYALRMWLD